jgi:hypothetical protein
MGYGQGFVTQAALLLDRMKDATAMLNWMARVIYDPQVPSFITPEGAELDPSGRFICRTGDEGNGVQEAEIVKALRILIGVDDTQPHELRIYPRMPEGWTEMAVDSWPALVERGGKPEIARLRYDLRRNGGRMSLQLSADRRLDAVSVRVGPFRQKPQAADVTVNGRSPAGADVEQSGDSWWVRFETSVEPAPAMGRNSHAAPAQRRN